jgi:hypothetical protein
MKNSENNFAITVKAELDNARWDFEACTPGNHYSDVEKKAIPYLESQRFSTEKIVELLKQDWSDIICNARNEKISHDDFAEFAARHIANELAFQRIYKFQVKSFENSALSNKWYINETVTFKLI